MGGNPHHPKHPIADTWRHEPSTASSFVRTNSAATAVEEVAGATAATASTVVLRDASGRAKFAAPAAAGDAMIYGTGESMQIFSEQVEHSDLTAAATTEAYALTGFPANSVLVDAWIDLDTVFSGGSVSACTVQLGDTASTDELMSAKDVFTGATLGLTYEDALAYVPKKEAAYAPELLVTTTDDNVVNLDAGDLTVYIRYMTMPV